MPFRILIIDGERTFREFLQEALEGEGYSVRTAANATVGLAVAREFAPDVVLLEQELPDGSGLDVLADLRPGGTGPAVIVLTAQGTYGAAVRAIKAGAFHYLVKPFAFGELLEALADASRNQAPRARTESETELGHIVGQSPEMRRLKSQIARVARAPVGRILVQGESGTGKELVATAIHRLSARAESRLVSVNCASLSDTLLMSELFGHEKGAFTDARERKVGLIEVASGGTLFLDEISELGARAQAALLRVLEQRVIRRIGSNEEIPVDIRIVAATNSALDEAVHAGRFRADLYYRLNVVQLSLPPLRERGKDVLLLSAHFCRYFAPKYGTPIPVLSARVRDALLSYPWPGNVRELRNAIEHAFVSGVGEELLPEHLPPKIIDHRAADLSGALRFGGLVDLPFPEAKQHVITEFERTYVMEALKRANGNVSRAAREAGLLRQALQRLVARHQVDVAMFR